MIIDGEAVARLRADRRMTLGEVAAAMRRTGLTGTSRSWVAIAEEGRWVDVPPAWVIGLAVALGSDLAEVTGRRHLIVATSPK